MLQAVHWLGTITHEDKDIVGEKAAKLGGLLHAGLTLPEGFVVAAPLYFRFLKYHSLTTKITHLLDTVTYTDPTSLLQVAATIRRLIMSAPLPVVEQKEIFTAYRRLGTSLSDSIVAIRPSPISDDINRMIFTGHPNTFLQVQGEANLLLKIKETWASLFEPRAIYYRHEKRVDHFRLGMGVIVQSMIHADISGSMYTVDPETNDAHHVVIRTFAADNRYTPTATHIVDKKSGMLSSENASPTTPKSSVLTKEQLSALSMVGKKIESHTYFPQEITWAIRNSVIYILQSDNFTPVLPEEKTTPLLSGSPEAPGIAYGKLALVLSPRDTAHLNRGDIAVVSELTEKQLPELKKVSGVIVEKKAPPSVVVAAVAKLGVPVISGVKNALTLLKPHQIISMDGKKGTVYAGSPLSPVSFESKHSNGKSLSTATKLYVTTVKQENIAALASLPIDGIGMLDGGKLVTEIGVHPKKVLREGNHKEYTAVLAEKIARYTAPFQPRPVFYRFSDLTSSAYKKLSSGKTYEPDEVNPLLGYHGAFRFLHDPQVFMLEIRSIKTVREKYGLRNICLILPSVRTVRELAAMKKLLAQYGLMRSFTNKVFLEVSLPANVISLEDYIKVGIDGLVINTDLLSSFILGIDPENSEVIHEFDEQHPAVLETYYHVIKTAQKHSLTTSIFGQAPSLYPGLIEKLVDWGISGISVTPYALEMPGKPYITMNGNSSHDLRFKI
jgi:pyruvate, water dikinase